MRDRITQVGIIPVVRATSSKQAMMAIEAVCHGGIRVVEVTMTVPGAVNLIAEVVRSMGTDVLVGAGTVLDKEVAQQCVDAGAEFIVSPGLNIAIIEFANAEDKCIIAGALTPTEIMAAWKAGADLVKVFPCGELGGPRYIKALRGPFPQIPMIPTGGVNFDTAAEFILAGAVALGIGGELVSSAVLKAGKSEVISDNARKFARIVRETRTQMQQKQDAIATIPVA